MAENIQVTLSPDRAVVGPGEKAEVTADILNAGDVVEVFSVEVQGIDADWYSLSVSSISLFPGDREKIRITLAPPLASASKAGSYTVSVKASSKRDPTVMTTAQMALDIGSVSSYELDLSPKMIRARKGSYRVVITNTGNITNTFKLEASDPEEMLNYGFKSDTVVVDPGTTMEVPLIVNPRKKPFTGAAKPFSFTVKAIPVASEIKTIQGQLECPPLLPKWAVLAIIGGVAVIVVVIVLVVVLTGDEAGFEPVNKSFQLKPERFKMYEVHLTEGTIAAEAQWSGADRLSLVLYGPGKGEPAMARSDGFSPLTISHNITSDDIERGESWRVYIANLSEDGKATGKIEVNLQL